MAVLYEVCCGSADDALQAAAGGADRVELNSALFLGGLTPSLGALQVTKKRSDVRVICMVRPREGGFCYSETEYAAMLADARALLAAGADGLAFGFLHDDGTVDEARTREFVALCGEKEAVFHRAFDVTPDRDAAMQTLIACGVKRVLTSGGACDAPSGKDELRRLQAAYGQQIEILPGGGIRAENAAQLAAYTGVSQVHGSARSVVRDTSTAGNLAIVFGGAIEGKTLPETEFKRTDAALVRAVKETLI